MPASPSRLGAPPPPRQSAPAVRNNRGCPHGPREPAHSTGINGQRIHCLRRKARLCGAGKSLAATAGRPRSLRAGKVTSP